MLWIFVGYLQAFSSGSAQASHCGGFSCCKAQASGTWASVVATCELRSWVAPWHVGSSRTKDWTHVPYIVRQILIHCITKEILIVLSLIKYFIFKGIIHSISKPLLCDQDLGEGVRSSVLGECSCVSKLPNPALHTRSLYPASSGLHPDTGPDSTGGDAWALQISGTHSPPWGWVLRFPSHTVMWLGPRYWSGGQEWTWDRHLKWL